MNYIPCWENLHHFISYNNIAMSMKRSIEAETCVFFNLAVITLCLYIIYTIYTIFFVNSVIYFI